MSTPLGPLALTCVKHSRLVARSDPGAVPPYWDRREWQQTIAHDAFAEPLPNDRKLRTPAVVFQHAPSVSATIATSRSAGAGEGAPLPTAPKGGYNLVAAIRGCTGVTLRRLGL